MKSFIIAAVAIVLTAGAASASPGDYACIATGAGTVHCGTVIIQR